MSDVGQAHGTCLGSGKDHRYLLLFNFSFLQVPPKTLILPLLAANIPETDPIDYGWKGWADTLG